MSNDERPDIWKVADALQQDLRNANAKLVQLRSLLSGFSIPETPRCPLCGYRSGMNMPSVSEHMERDHSQPVQT